jgi:hypothetical protein
MNNYTGLFAFRGRARQALKPSEDAGTLAQSECLTSSRCSGFHIPTAAYVGGPAEVAYFAQASVYLRYVECPCLRSCQESAPRFWNLEFNAQ